MTLKPENLNWYKWGALQLDYFFKGSLSCPIMAPKPRYQFPLPAISFFISLVMMATNTHTLHRNKHSCGLTRILPVVKTNNDNNYNTIIIFK